MSTEVVTKNDSISVVYYPEHKIIHHTMHQQVQGSVFRDSLMAATDYLISHNAHKWLSDDRLNPLLQPSDQKWVADVWQPKVLKAGWKHWALVLPEKDAGKVRMGLMAKQYLKLGVTVKIFEDANEGLAWLKSV